jgi:hypothetical protein
MRLFDFRCPDGHKFEDLVKSNVTTSRCSCGLDAKRIISPVRSNLEGISGDFPDAHDRWVKRRESHMAYERRQSSH